MVSRLNWFLLIVVLMPGGFGCQREADTFENSFGLIKEQIFKINAQIDTTLISKEGVIIKIPRYSFIFGDSSLYNGNVEIVYREIVKKEDFILSHVPTRTTSGEILESGGMIYLEAFSEEHKSLKLNKDTPLLVEFPILTESNEMKLFQGINRNDEINWHNPMEISVQVTPVNEFELKEESKIKPEDPNINTDEDFTYILTEEIAADTVAKNENESPIDKYLFELKDLGWINIDRFYDDPKSKPIEYYVSLSHSSFDDLYVSLILKERNVHLLAYETKDGRFSFTHGDHEKLATLPVGERAYLYAKGIKNDALYYDLKEVVIGDRSEDKLDMKEASEAEIINKVKEVI